MKEVKVVDNPWMQRWIAGTNGLHYLDQVNKIQYYPVFNIPIPKTNKANAISLEVGTGWGRWMPSAARKGYIPVGIDLKIEDAKSVFKTLQAFGKTGYMVLTDLENLPFKQSVFDLVWSFSVIQHVHYKKAKSCFEHISRVLNHSGFAFIELPNKNGIRNRFGPVKAEEPHKNEDSMAVRYYTIDEYKSAFFKPFSKVEAHIHSMIGIGVLPEDLKYVSWKKKMPVAASLASTAIAKIIPGTANIADSLYFKLTTSESAQPAGLSKFIEAHNKQYTNLNIVHLMQCPFTGGELIFSEDKKYLISQAGGRKFPIVDDVPVMLPDSSEAL